MVLLKGNSATYLEDIDRGYQPTGERPTQQAARQEAHQQAESGRAFLLGDDVSLQGRGASTK